MALNIEKPSWVGQKEALATAEDCTAILCSAGYFVGKDNRRTTAAKSSR
jgi:hypothetical protein